MNRRSLFTLAEDEARSVHRDDQGIYHIDSIHASDEEKKDYNAFVYDLHDGKLTGGIRRFFNRQYSLFFSVKPSLLTKVFAGLFLPFFPVSRYGNILDVGCSTGLFLAYLPDEWQKYGLELNTKAVAIARERGLNVTAASLESFQTDTRFEVIRASHVLEHVKEYRSFLSVASGLLKPEGLLVIYTPNGDSFSRRLTGRFWAGFYDQTHFTIFDLKNIIAVAKEFGLEPVFRSTYYMGSLGDSVIRALGIGRHRTFFVHILQIIFYPLSFFERLFHKSDALVVYFKKKQI